MQIDKNKQSKINSDLLDHVILHRQLNPTTEINHININHSLTLCYQCKTNLQNLCHTVLIMKVSNKSQFNITNFLLSYVRPFIFFNQGSVLKQLKKQKCWLNPAWHFSANSI